MSAEPERRVLTYRTHSAFEQDKAAQQADGWRLVDAVLRGSIIVATYDRADDD